jgi:hypothetical protein
MDKLVNLIKSYPDQINALAAVCALFVSFLSILLTFLALRLQRRHNFKSLTPIASILIGDYEQEILVKLRNTGVGPLIVERFTTSDGNKEEDDIISWMPALPEGIYWASFTENIDGWCIAPNKEAVIIKLSGNPSDRRFALFRNEVRRALSKLTVTVKYKDIYDRRMPIKQRDLKWFARHFGNLDLPISK